MVTYERDLDIRHDIKNANLVEVLNGQITNGIVKLRDKAEMDRKLVSVKNRDGSGPNFSSLKP